VNAETLKKQYDVLGVFKNGPRGWAMHWGELSHGVTQDEFQNICEGCGYDMSFNYVPMNKAQLSERTGYLLLSSGRGSVYEAGRDGFWLARWLRAREIEAYVIHPSSVPVSREHRRAKTDRLDTELLKRAFLGWLRGEPKHCSMAAIPTLADEDAKRPGRERQSLVGERTRIINRLKANLARLGIRNFRPNLAHASNRLEALRTPEGSAVPANTLAELRRDMDRLRFVKQQIKEIETTRAKHLAEAPNEQRQAMVRLLARVVGVGIETADMLAQEVFSRNIRDRKALARYAGLTGAPDESGKKRREQGLAKAGNARVRRGMIELAWGHLLHQKASALTAWYRKRTSDARGGTRKTMIVALARKLLIALWRLVTTGETPAGLLLRPAA
jgi:transposase